jgi:hypothetical protein
MSYVPSEHRYPEGDESVGDEREGLTVACGNCGGNVFMATCDCFRGTGHDWVLASLCMICRAVHWVDGGCPECP